VYDRSCLVYMIRALPTPPLCGAELAESIRTVKEAIGSGRSRTILLLTRLLRVIEKPREGPWIENPSWRLYLEIAGIKTHSLDCDIYNRIHDHGDTEIPNQVSVVDRSNPKVGPRRLT